MLGGGKGTFGTLSACLPPPANSAPNHPNKGASGSVGLGKAPCEFHLPPPPLGLPLPTLGSHRVSGVSHLGVTWCSCLTQSGLGLNRFRGGFDVPKGSLQGLFPRDGVSCVLKANKPPSSAQAVLVAAWSLSSLCSSSGIRCLPAPTVSFRWEVV